MQYFQSLSAAASSFLIYTLFGGLLITLLSQGSVINMLILIRTLALMLHLPCFRITFPSNAMLFISLLISMV